jgi:putative transposase
MARPLRLDYPGAVWHLTSRGNERREIFRDDRDRERFLDQLARVVEAMRWRLHAHVLMSNHFHLLVETPEANLSEGMRQLNGVYTQWFNKRHGRVGRLMQGRFKAIHVEKQSHLLELARYVVLNPVRAGLVRSAGQWRWSSYRATAGLAKRPNWLDVDWIRDQFGGNAAGARRYRKFVADAKGSRYAPWGELKSQVFLGGEAFRRRVQKMTDGRPRSVEIPRVQRRVVRPTLEALLTSTAREFRVSEAEWKRRRHTPARMALAWLARTESAMALRDFAPALGVKPWAASHLAIAAQERAATDRGFRKRLQRLQASLRDVTSSQT